MAQSGTLITRRYLLRLLGIGSAACIGSPLLTSCAVDPVTGKKQLMLMSEQQEIALDRQQSPFQFSSDFGAIDNQDLNRYIGEVGNRLVQHSHRPQMPFSFRGVNAAYINAYAFPGGSIAVTRGILIELQNEAELAALLGHEIGHVCARHTAEQASKNMLSSLLLTGASLATSAAGYSGAADLVQGVGGLGAGALLARYSRDNEREADSLGMEYMVRAGYGPEGMVGLMEILLDSGKSKPSAIELMFSTHPMSRERYTFAREASATTYASHRHQALYRERFMDETAPLRRKSKAITSMQKAASLLAGKQYPQAESLLNDALKAAPLDYAALVMAAQCQFAMKRVDRARRYALKATDIYPGEAQAHVLVGVCGILKKDYGNAYEHLSEYDRLLPGVPDIAFFQGYAMEGMERQVDAAGYYQRYLQQVRQGEKAQHAYNRLRSWGYIR